MAAPNREEIDKAIERYRHPDAFSHELIHAWTRAQVELRHIGITSQQAAAFQHLGRYLVYPDNHLRADPETVRKGLRSQSALWPMAISGDFPIFSIVCFYIRSIKSILPLGPPRDPAATAIVTLPVSSESNPAGAGGQVRFGGLNMMAFCGQVRHLLYCLGR